MDAETINRKIHEWMGKCWHEPKSAPSKWGWDLIARCSKCDCQDAWRGNDFVRPLYTTDLNAVREAELKCIEEFGAEEYLTVLTGQVLAFVSFDSAVEEEAAIATATALERAQAVYDVLEKGK